MSGPYQRLDLSNCGAGRLHVAINNGHTTTDHFILLTLCMWGNKMLKSVSELISLISCYPFDFDFSTYQKSQKPKIETTKSDYRIHYQTKM